MTKIPTRRCAACRCRDEKAKLLRFVCNDDGPQFDSAKRAPGRGVYVHPTVPCWSRLSDPGLWEWGLKVERSALTKDRIRAAMEQAQSILVEADPSMPKPSGRKVRL